MLLDRHASVLKSLADISQVVTLYDYVEDVNRAALVTSRLGSATLHDVT